MHHKLFIIALLLVLTAGCGSSTSQNTAQPPDEKAASTQAETKKVEAPKPPPAPPDEAFTAAEQKPVPPPKAKGPVSPTPPPGMTMEKAQVGSGDKGRGYGGGIIGTPVSTYFAAKERIMFEIQIPECLRAYKFENDFKGPKTNEEFMEKVIKKNGIQLPTLPPGHSYIYDPKEEQLMVIRPE
ncbi:MAG: hypothetical protein ABSE63_08015 [Thermoguttaceae bacterium]|jgi:hypothetical protein